jgi:hypothetical protein
MAGAPVPVWFKSSTLTNGDTQWSSCTKTAPTPRGCTYYDSALSNGNDTGYGMYDLQQAEAKCSASPECKGFTHEGEGPLRTSAVVPIWFKSSAGMNGDNKWGAYIKGDTPPPSPPAPTPAPMPPPTPAGVPTPPPTPASKTTGWVCTSWACHAKVGGTEVGCSKEYSQCTPPTLPPTPVPGPAAQCKGCASGSSGECKSLNNNVCYKEDAGTCPAESKEPTTGHRPASGQWRAADSGGGGGGVGPGGRKEAPGAPGLRARTRGPGLRASCPGLRSTSPPPPPVFVVGACFHGPWWFWFWV